MKRLLACAALVSLTAFGYDESTITSVDWSAQSGTYTIPAGVTNLVTEADIGSVNALDKIVFGDADSALLFTSTTAPAVKFSGTGTVIKEGAADWTLSVVQDDTSFLGNWDIREGTVRVGALGANASNTTLFSNVTTLRHCWIRKGATFVYDVSGNFPSVNFHLAGTLEVAANSTSVSFQSISLDDDALIDQSDGKYIFISRRSDDGGVSLDLNGHKLTCKLATNIYFYRGTIAGPGTVRLENVSTKACCFYLRSEGAVRGFTDPTVTLECGDNTGFYLQGHPTNPQVATMVVEGKGFLAHSHKDDTCAAHSDACLFWDGPVVLTNATSVLNVNNTVSEAAHVGIRGKVSGPGSLAFATSSSYAYGTYCLNNAENDFTGSLTLNSRANVLYRMTGTAQRYASMDLTNVAVDWTLVPSDPLVRPTEKIRVDEFYQKEDNTDRLKVGDRAFGKLTIVEGVSITERLCLGSYSSASDAVRGVIRQTGGDISLIGQYKDGNQGYSSILGNWGQGGYSLEGGALTLLGHCHGANYGNLVFHQSGGTLKVVKYPWGTQATDPYFSLGVTCGTADLIFTGGTADLGALLYMSRGSNAAISPQTLSSLTVDGTAEVSATSVFTYNKDGCVATVNLRGGRLTAQWYASSSSTPYDAWVYFDGGTFVLRRDVVRGEFGGNDADHAPATLRVGPRGGTLDAQGHYQKVYVPFDAQQDGVVTAIPWTDTTTVYPAPPTVVISGSGRHATAYADYDYATGTIRGIVVTCGGEGYVAGETTAQLEYCHANLKDYPHEDLLAEPIVCTVGNVTSGGMTFRGTGVAEDRSNYIGLCCTNTYAGATTVDMQTDPETEKPGVLYCYADDQFPNSHKLVVKSGHLVFNSYAQSSFTELEMSGGKMSGYPSGEKMTLAQATFAGTPNLGNVPMTVEKIVVDAANPPTLTLAKITAARDAKITVKNAASLANIEKGVTLFAYDLQGDVTVENPDDLPANVKLTWSNGRLRASRTDRGSMVLIR